MMRLISQISVATLLATLVFGVYAEPKTNPSTSQVVLKSKSQAELSSQLDAVIISLPKDEGDSFKKGDALVVFDCTIYEAKLSQAKANVHAKQILYDSNLRMQKARALSAVELAESNAKLEEAKSALKIRQYDVDMCKIKAPFDGELVKCDINAFETVRRGQPLVEVLDNNNLEIELIVPSRWLTWLAVNEPFTLYVEETGKNYLAHVTKVLPSVDAVSQSVRLLGKLDEHHKELISGMSGRADFHLRRKQ